MRCLDESHALTSCTTHTHHTETRQMNAHAAARAREVLADMMLTKMPKTIGEWTLSIEPYTGVWVWTLSCADDETLHVYATPFFEVRMASVPVQVLDDEVIHLRFEPTYDVVLDVARYCSIMGGLLPILRQRAVVAGALADLSSVVDVVTSVHAPLVECPDRLPGSHYGVLCDSCGSQGLSAEDYDRQMMRPDSLWKCPVCGDAAMWDDIRYEKGEQLIEDANDA